MARKGIAVISVKEPEFEGSIKILMLPIMAAIDEYQGYFIGEDTLRGMRTLARQGYSSVLLDETPKKCATPVSRHLSPLGIHTIIRNGSCAGQLTPYSAPSTDQELDGGKNGT